MGMMIIRHKVRDYGQWRSSGKFQEGKLQAFDELGHKSKVERINCIAGKVIVWIPEESGVRHHHCRQACIPKRGVITHARFRQNAAIERQEKRISRANPCSYGSPRKRNARSAVNASCRLHQ